MKAKHSKALAERVVTDKDLNHLTRSIRSFFAFISFLTGLVCLFEHGRCGRDEQFRGCLLSDCMIRRLGLVQLLEIMPAFETETQR